MFDALVSDSAQLRIARIMLAAFTIAPTTTHASSDVVSLVCRGSLSTNIDLKDRPPQSTILSIIIRPTQQRLTVDGYWGCMNTEIPTTCTDLAIEESESQFKHGHIYRGRSIQGNQLLVIDRTSGVLRTLATTQALPGSGARWGVMLVTGEFDCTIASKKF
jgi:hypothetical protein